MPQTPEQRRLAKQNETPEHRAARIERQRAYYRANSEKFNARHRDDYARKKEKYKEYNKKYQAEHRDEILASHKRYYAENKDILRPKQKEYARAHAGEIREAHRKWVSTHRDLDRAAKKQWEERNEERIQRDRDAKTVAMREKVRVAQLELGGKCERCGATDERVLDFVRIDKTDPPVAKLRNKPTEEFLVATRKTRLLCSNCDHLEMYYPNDAPHDDPLLATLKTDLGGACVTCGTRDLRLLDFDHIDPTTKLGNVSEMSRTHSLAAVKLELAKCQILCGNCHRVKTWTDRSRLARPDFNPIPFAATPPAPIVSSSK